MSDSDSTGMVEYKQIGRFAGYRFSNNGNVQTRWVPELQPGVSGPRRFLRDEWLDEPTFPVPSGYVLTHVYQGKRRLTRKVHNLMLEAFVGPCPPGMECRHLDGVRNHNVLSNLVWGTKSENTIDQVKHGTHHMIKLAPELVRSIRAEFAVCKNRSMLARKHGLDKSTIWHLIAGNTWKHVV
jgi:HNH endonuclease